MSRVGSKVRKTDNNISNAGVRPTNGCCDSEYENQEVGGFGTVGDYMPPKLQEQQAR